MVQPGGQDEAPAPGGSPAAAGNAGGGGQRDQKQLPVPRTELLSKEEVKAALELTSNPQLVLPLEHRHWSKEELELYVMSDGALRPKWCSLPDENLFLGTDLSEDELQEALQTAAEWLRSADGLLVGSGAGMGVSSGLATFRGSEGGVWPAFQDLGLSYEELCDPRWFTEDPRLVWGFWLFCHEAYRRAEPHAGYAIVRKWAELSTTGGYSFTSNIDNHWERSGWKKDRMLECHGALRWLQCSTPCSQDVWETPDDLSLHEDPRTHRAMGDLPVCPKCGAVARPCVLMFGGDSGFSKSARKDQEWFYHDWYGRMKFIGGLGPQHSDALLVCLELGCGVTVPTVRAELQRAMDDCPNARLIRVNPENPGFTKALKGRAVSLPLGAMEALEQLDALIDNGPMGRFIIHDNYGGGVEMQVPRCWPFHRLFRKALVEMEWVGSGEELVPLAMNIYQRQGKMKKMEWHDEEALPEELFFEVDGLEDPPGVCILCHGGYFSGKNAALEARFGRVWHLLTDLIMAFKAEPYQQRLAVVKDRQELRDMIKEVHLEVLPRHGYQVSEDTKPGPWMAIQTRMQAFIQSGDWWHELRKVADMSQEVSGGFKMHSLPLPQKTHRASKKAVCQ